MKNLCASLAESTLVHVFFGGASEIQLLYMYLFCSLGSCLKTNVAYVIC